MKTSKVLAIMPEVLMPSMDNLDTFLETYIETYNKTKNNILESLLQEYKNLCKSDKEFSKRTSAYCVEGHPEFTQYLFDEEPIFYSIVLYENNKVLTKFIKGKYQYK